MSARRLDRISLRVARSTGTRDEPAEPRMRWWVAALVGAVGVALAGWCAAAGLVVLAWATAASGSVLAALRTGTQLWLLVHGASVRIGTLLISLPPLLLSGVVALLLAGAASYAARQAKLADPDVVVAPAVATRNVTGVVTGAYLLVVAVAAVAGGDVAQLPRALIGTLLVALPATFAGAAATLGYRPTAGWPAWARSVPRAAAAAVGVVALFALAAIVAAMVKGGARIHTLEAALNAGPVARVVLGLIELAFAPTLLLWAMSYVLGAGFSVGTGTVVSLSRTQLGLLPGFPILGALPDNGPGSPALLWWLLSGVVAGAVAGYLVVQARPPARADETALVGGLSGVVAGLAIVVLCALSTGGFGADRMAVMGPRLKELAIFGTSTLGLAGMAAGLVLGLLRPRPRPETAAAGEGSEDGRAAADEPR